jgi:hypothetical protein
MLLVDISGPRLTVIGIDVLTTGREAPFILHGQ